MIEPLEELTAMLLPERIEALSRDVVARTDRYRAIPAHDLASLLGIDDADRPGPDWMKIKYAQRVPLAENIEHGGLDSSIFDCLRGRVSIERWKSIELFGEDFDRSHHLDVSVLTQQERDAIEENMANEELERTENVIARISVQTADGASLEFEGFIECDGECISLLTPYDARDGKFTDLASCETEYF